MSSGADILIGIDAGTSVIKSVAFTLAGEEIAIAARPNRFERVNGGGAEQDMLRTFADTAATLAELAERVPDLAARTLAVAVTGQGDGTWLIDAEGEPCGPGLLWLDARAGAIAAATVARPDYAEHYETTGSGINACQQSMQLLWLAENRPEALARATHAMHCKDYLFFRLTGARVTDPSEAVFTFGDFRTRAYDPRIPERLGLGDAARLIAPIFDATREARPLTGAAARQVGLLPGTPVVLGFLDVMCTALGGGLYDREGRAGCTVIGSTGVHLKLAPHPDAVRLNTERTGYTMPFPVGEALAQMQSNMAATLNIDWLLDVGRELLAAHGQTLSRGDMLAGLDPRILAARPGAALFHPYISEAGERGPFMDPAARAQFSGLAEGTGYFDLMRAIYEGLGFAARGCYQVMGGVPEEVRVTGGAARSEAIRAIFAGALGVPVRRVDRDEAGAAGAAMMAAVQQGVYPDMTACAAEWVAPRLGGATVPDPALVAIYDGLFPIYQRTWQAMRPAWHDLAQLRRTETT